MSLNAGKEWIADVYIFGFVALHTISKDNVLTLCSPSGHVLIFTKTGPALHLPMEVRDILYKIKGVKKVALFKEVVERFLTSNGIDPLMIVDPHPIAKKTLRKSASAYMISSNNSLAKTSFLEGLLTSKQMSMCVKCCT